MARQLNIFRGSTGINNKVDPVRLKYNPETGIQDLAAAINVDIDRTGRVGRRKGYELALQKGAHSLFSCGSYCLFIGDNALCVLEPDYSWAAIRNVTVGARMSCVRAGDNIYYTNGYEKGVVVDKLSYNWLASSYVGPITTRTFSDPPVGHLLELFNGMMLIAQDDVLWHSEPFAYSWFDLAKNYIQFSDRLVMVKAVQSGIFVGTEKETFFLKGSFASELQQIKIADYPAVEGTVVQVEASKIGDGSMAGIGLMWASEEGICFGGSDGLFRNLTERKLSYPSARYGAGLCRDGKYICLLQP